jgi:hypothetical protein
MNIFRRRNPHHLIPIHADNAANNDWIILLEAGTIIGPSAEKLRVARTTQEHKVVKRIEALQIQHYLLVEGYDRRIHSLFFCPQLYKYDNDNRLVPLQGDEIGKYIAQALAHKTQSKRPWYCPQEKLPDDPPISDTMLSEFDTLLVDPPEPRRAITAPPAPHPMHSQDFEAVRNAQN